MPDEGARLTPEALVIFKTLDFCKSPSAPVGYPIVGKLDQSIRTASTVNETGQQAFTAFSRVATVVGNEAGVGGGVMSSVNKGMCKPVAWSQTVRMEGQWAIMNSVKMMMNCMGPEGSSNTFGTLVYVKSTAAAVVGPGGEIVVDKSKGADDSDSESTNDTGVEESPDGDEGAINDKSELSPEDQAEYDRLQDELNQTEADIQATENDLADAESKAEGIDSELAFELAQMAVDAAGTLDPTPTSDAISAGMSLSKGDYGGAVLSGISMIPWLGDALAKPAKAAKALKAVKRLRAAYRLAKAGVKKLFQKLSKLKDKAKKLRQKMADLLKKKGKKGKGGSGEVRIKDSGSGGGGFKGRRGHELKNAEYQKVRNKPANIGGREYSGHAIDQMENRGIPPSAVENSIKHGIPSPGNKPGTTVFFDSTNGIRTVTNDSGKVITTMYGSK